jgi:GH25 family lysozyme M1 (1,4-beta-N-acetylmuramidase)
MQPALRDGEASNGMNLESPMVLRGFDISDYQGEISLPRFREARAAGYGFVCVKASEGVGYKDPSFDVNWTSSGAAGFARIAYHFARPDLGNTSPEESDWFLTCLDDRLEAGDNVAVDSETGTGEVGAYVYDVLSRVRQALGVAKPFVYTGNWFIPGHLDYGPLREYPLWDAVYNAGNQFPEPVGPWSGRQVVIWQHTDQESVPGVGWWTATTSTGRWSSSGRSAGEGQGWRSGTST